MGTKKVAKKSPTKSPIGSPPSGERLQLHEATPAEISAIYEQRRQNDWIACRNSVVEISLEGVMAHPASFGIPAPQIANRVVEIGIAVASLLYPAPAVVTPEEEVKLAIVPNAAPAVEAPVQQ